jgi:hypothetical protein
VDRSLRRLGQLLVVMGALFGAVLGVSLALMVENADPSGAVAPGRERAAVLAASPSSTTPSASRAAGTQDAGRGTDAPGNQRAESAGRGDQHDGKAGKKGGRGKDEADGRGKGKAGKAKDKGK